MRRQGSHALYAWIAVLALTALLAVLANGSMALPGIPVATATPSLEAATTVAPAQAGPLLSDSRGFIALPGKTAPGILRRETDGDPIIGLRGQGFVGAVSSTGRRVAYWASGSAATDGGPRELRVFDVSAADQDTRLTTLSETERGALVAWSADRSGVLVVVEASGRPGTADVPEPFSALRVVDVPTRSIREIARVTDGSQFWPVGWDRVARLVGACVYRSDGMAIAWSGVGEDTLSSDGALAFVTHDGGRSATAVDLATGVLAPLPMSGAELVATISFR